MNNRISFRSGKAKYLKYFIIVIILVIGVLAIRTVLANSSSSSQTTKKLQLKNAVAEKSIGKDISIPLTGAEGEEVTPVTMRIENIELREEIIVQGQKATSVPGRSFFVVNLKLSNPLKQGVEISTKDYLRLVENDGQEWLAPDIHNDPVVIQAISTKPTRVAFPVNAATRRFSLQVGEITGEKEKIEIDFNQ